MLNNEKEKIVIEYINKYQCLTARKGLKILDISDREYFSLDDWNVECERANIWIILIIINYCKM